MDKKFTKQEVKPVYKPIVGSNTMQDEKGNIAYLDCMVWDDSTDYTGHIVK